VELVAAPSISRGITIALRATPLGGGKLLRPRWPRRLLSTANLIGGFCCGSHIVVLPDNAKGTGSNDTTAEGPLLTWSKERRPGLQC
jgi:hypothetical protein